MSSKFILWYFFFFTSGAATTFQIFTLFWQVESVLQLMINVWCVHGASLNQKIFQVTQRFTKPFT